MYKLLVTGITVLFLFFPGPVSVQGKQLLKIATLAPEGSVWVEHFRGFADEVKEKTGGEVVIKIYPGGVMGDDLAMYRKIRAGQLHGGGFTMTGIANIVPDFRVMAIPFYFRDYAEVDAAIEAMAPYFTKSFSDAGLEFLALTEVGFIYTMSTAPVATIDDLRTKKSWIPSDDPLTAQYLDNLGITPIPLSIPDVMSSLQTGLIDTVYTSLYGAIVMQWFTRAVYITDLPFGYAYGAVILSEKAFARLKPSQQKIVRQSAASHFNELNSKTRQTNSQSREVLKQNGVTFVEAAPGAYEQLRTTQEKTAQEVAGTLFSRKAYTLMSDAIKKVGAKR